MLSDTGDARDPGDSFIYSSAIEQNYGPVTKKENSESLGIDYISMPNPKILVTARDSPIFPVRCRTKESLCVTAC